MRKLIYCLFALSIVLGCSSDDGGTTNDPQGEDDPQNFIVQIAGNYLVNDTTLEVVLSDEDGNIITSGFAQNNSTLTLQADFDTETIDATFVLAFGGTDSYFVNTYKDVGPYTIKLVEALINVNSDALTLRFNDMNEFDLFAYGTSDNEAKGILTSENNGTFTISATPPRSPGGYFVSFYDLNGGVPRYFWSSDVSGNQEINESILNLPFMEQSINLTFPENGLLNVSITGFSDADASPYEHSVFTRSYSFGDGNNIDFHLPASSVFDRYRYFFRYNTDTGIKYYLQRGGSLPNAIQTPNMDAVIGSSSVNDFNMTTSGSYDAYSVHYIDFSGVGGTRNYRIHGKSSSAVSFSAAPLYDAIFASVNQVSSANLEFSRVSLRNDQSVNSYADYVIYESGSEDLRPQNDGSVVEVVDKLE